MSLTRTSSQNLIPFAELELLLQNASCEEIFKLMDAGRVEIEAVFSSQNSASELEREPLINLFYRKHHEITLKQIETMHNVLKQRNIQPSANAMLAIFNNLTFHLVHGKTPERVCYIVRLFEDLYADKADYRTILQTPTKYHHHVYSYLAETVASEFLQKITDDLDIDVNAKNKIIDNYNTYKTTVCEVAQRLFYEHGTVVNTDKDVHQYISPAQWIKDRGDVIKFLVSRNASLHELHTLFERHEDVTRGFIEDKTMCVELKTTMLQEYLDAARIIIESINAGLALKVKPALLSSASGLFGEPNDLEKILNSSRLQSFEKESKIHLEGLTGLQQEAQNTPANLKIN